MKWIKLYAKGHAVTHPLCPTLQSWPSKHGFTLFLSGKSHLKFKINKYKNQKTINKKPQELQYTLLPAVMPAWFDTWDTVKQALLASFQVSFHLWQAVFPSDLEKQFPELCVILHSWTDLQLGQTHF